MSVGPGLIRSFCFILRWCFSEMKYIKRFISGKCSARICWAAQVQHLTYYYAVPCSTHKARKLVAVLSEHSLKDCTKAHQEASYNFGSPRNFLGEDTDLTSLWPGFETIFAAKVGGKKLQNWTWGYRKKSLVITADDNSSH